jgi:MFS family permease
MATETLPDRSLRNLWRAVFWVSFPFGILTFILPIYGKELGASALEVGGFFSAAFLAPVFVRPFLGRALDKWGRRPFFLIGLAGYLLSMVIFSGSTTVLWLTIARFIQGLGTAFLWLTAYTIVADLAAKKHRGHEFGSIDEAINRGAILGTTIGFTIIFTLEGFSIPWVKIWFWLFLGYSVLAVIGLIFGIRGVPESRPVETTEAEKRPISAQLLALMAIVFMTGASSTMIWPLLMIFLQEVLNADVSGLALAYLPAALLSAFLPSRLGRVADRWGRKGPMIAGLLIGSLASALMPRLGSILALTVLWAVESLGYIVAMPAERAFVADIAGEDVRGTSYGMYTFAFFLGAVVGPLIGGWFYDNLGQATPFYLNSVVLLLGGVLVALVLKETVEV